MKEVSFDNAALYELTQDSLELIQEFPDGMVEDCLNDLVADDLDRSEDSGGLEDSLEDITEAHENLQIRFIIYQLKSPGKKGKKILTLTKHKSNLNSLLPEKAYKKLLRELSKPKIRSEVDYQIVYCKRLVNMLRKRLESELKSESLPATRYSKLHTARLFLRFQGLEGYLKIPPFNTKIKRGIRIPISITDDEFTKFIRTIANTPTPNNGLNYKIHRDLALYSLMRTTGATPSELVNLEYRDFKIKEDGRITSVELTNKDNEKRKMPVGEITSGYLIGYIRDYNIDSERHPIKEGKLFRNNQYKKISTRYLGKNLEKYARQAMLERQNLEPMSLRYAFAKEQSDSGASAEELAELLGIKEERAREIIIMLKGNL